MLIPEIDLKKSSGKFQQVCFGLNVRYLIEAKWGIDVSVTQTMIWFG